MSETVGFINIFDYPVGICNFLALKDKLLPCRAVERLPENSKSVIVTVFPYKIKEQRPTNISRYAAIDDYHGICCKMLEKYAEKLRKLYPDNKFEPFIDNSPIPEVFAAVKAGLGVKGQNGLLITPDYGSFVFIGEIVTDLELSATDNSAACVGCGECKAACPVGLSKNECLSAVTQKKGKLSSDEQALIYKCKSVWGCDICQNICPMNRSKKLSDITEFTESYRFEYKLGENAENRPYNWRGKAPIERNAKILENNE